MAMHRKPQNPWKQLLLGIWIFVFTIWNVLLLSFSNDQHNPIETINGADIVTPPLPPSNKQWPLEKITQNQTIVCEEPLVPIYDHVVPYHPNATSHNIPKIIHISMKSRCVPPDLQLTAHNWIKALPEHSLYFHDDAAVDRLLYEMEWPEFPQLVKLLRNCVKFSGAMTIDLWRVLVLYRYGGIYTDIDVWPTREFTEELIQDSDEALFFSDAWNRPTQWFMAMTPSHPIAYFAMHEIFHNLMELPNVQRNVKLVFVTGPEALKSAYMKVLGLKDRSEVGPGRSQVGKFGRHVRKIKETSKYVTNKLGGTYNDIVLYDGKNMTRKEMIEEQNGVLHWTKVMWRKKKQEATGFEGPCLDALFTSDQPTKNESILSSL